MNCGDCGSEVDPRKGFCEGCGAYVIDMSYVAPSRPQPTRFHSRLADAPPPTPGAAPPPPDFSSGLWRPPHAWQRADLPAPEEQARTFRIDIEPEPAPEREFEETILLPRRDRTRFWAIDVPGQSVEVVVTAAIVGRSASPLPEWPGAKLISVADATRSVSKNHAVFVARDGVLTVEDLESTNGVVVTLSDGSEVDAGRRGRVELDEDSTVELGELRIRVRQLANAAARR